MISAKMWAWVLTCVALIECCSCSSGDDLYQYSSSDDLTVMSMNIQSIVDNAGCTVDKDGINLSESLQTLMSQMVRRPSEREELNKILACQGIDLSQMVLSVSNNLEPALTFKVTNQKNFKSYLESISYGELTESEEKGYTIYTIGGSSAIFLTSNIACLLFSEHKTVSATDIATLKERAQNTPLQKWQKETLESGKTFNMLLSFAAAKDLMNKYNSATPFSYNQFSMAYDPAALETAYLTVNSTLEGVKLSGDFNVVGNDGKPLESKYAKSEVNLDLMKYAGEKDIMLAIGAVPAGVDYADLLKQMVNEMGGPSAFGLDNQSLSIIGAVLNNLDGTVMLAAGPDNLMKINSPAGWSAVLVAEMKDGAAKQYVEMAKNFIDINNEHMSDMAADYRKMGLSYSPKTIETSYTDGKLAVQLPGGGTLNVQAIGNDFVATLGEISTAGGCKIDTTPLKGATGGVIIDLPRYNAFSSFMTFPFGINLSTISYADKTTFSLSETETEGLLLDNIFKFVASQMR